MRTFTIFNLLVCILISFFWMGCEEPCPNGYYGENCEEKEYDKFLNEYTGTVNCGAGSQLTTLKIIPEPLNPPFHVLIDLQESSSLSGLTLKAQVLKDTLYVDDQLLKIPVGADTTRLTFYASRGVLTNDTTLTLKLILSTDLNPSLKISCNYNLVKK
jgi:hypothetical protein